MKSVLLILLSLFISVIIFYGLVVLYYCIYTELKTNINVEAIMPGLLLLGSIPSYYFILDKLIPKTIGNATYGFIFHSIAVALFLPVWYPSLTGTTGLSFILVGFYIYFRPYLIKRIKDKKKYN